MITCPECHGDQFQAFVEMRSTVGDVDQTGGAFYIPPSSLEEPDWIDVIVACAQCGETILLSNSQWETQ